MITEWIVGLASTVWTWLAQLWPTWTAPPFLANIDDTINGFMSNAAGIGAWIDWVFILACVTLVLGVWGVAFLVKVALRIAAYIPFFGGAG